jgi:Poly(hydroxyalcanoate) granule associated protein (phasin)
MMVSKTRPSGPKTPVAAKQARKRDPVTSETPATQAKPNLLRAGLKALGNVRDDVVQHQSRVFEAILGIEAGQGWAGLVKRDAPTAKAAKVAQEAFGLRKFEAVFDQRVVSALERMGMPSIETLQSLTHEISALRAEVAELKATKPSPVRRKR